MILQFSMYFRGIGPVYCDYAVDPECIVDMVDGDDSGHPVVCIRLDTKDTVIVWDMQRDAHQRWAEALGCALAAADDDSDLYEGN